MSHSSAVRLTGISPDDRHSQDHGTGYMRAHRIANAVGERFAERPDRFRVRKGDARNPLFKHSRKGDFNNSIHALGFAPEFAAGVDSTVADLVAEMRTLAGVKKGFAPLDGKTDLDTDFQNEAVLWTMVRSFLENKLTAEGLKAGRPDFRYRSRVLSGIYDNFEAQTANSSDELMRSGLEFVGAFLPEAQRIVEFYPSSEVKSLYQSFERFAINCADDIASFQIGSGEQKGAGITQAVGSLKQGVKRFLADLQRVQGEANLLDEKTLRGNMKVALDPFIDDLQAEILAKLSKDGYCDDERDVEVKLMEILANTKFGSAVDRIAEAVSKSTTEDLDPEQMDILAQSAFLRMSILWSGNNGLFAELIDHLKAAGHLGFLHQQALKAHTKTRLDGVVG